MLARSRDAVVPTVTAKGANTAIGASRTIQFQNRRLARRIVSRTLSRGARSRSLSLTRWLR
jgi:hypothetical protein